MSDKQTVQRTFAAISLLKAGELSFGAAFLCVCVAAVPCTGSPNLGARIYRIYAFCDTMTGTKGIIIDPWCPTFVDRTTPGALLRALRFAPSQTQWQKHLDKSADQSRRVAIQEMLSETILAAPHTANTPAACSGSLLRAAQPKVCPPGGRCPQRFGP